jgi:hypothetical protein
METGGPAHGRAGRTEGLLYPMDVHGRHPSEEDLSRPDVLRPFFSQFSDSLSFGYRARTFSDDADVTRADAAYRGGSRRVA